MKKLCVQLAAAVLAVLLPPAAAVFAGEQDSTRADYLGLVKSYAEAMITQGRDTYGKLPSPLFAAALDRKTLRLAEGQRLEQIRGIPREGWGIRPHDRMLSGANPQHDENLYQILYALSKLTGEKCYAEEANRTLKWFFEHCQSKTTGLLAWGEHIGWDFYTETVIDKPAGTTHEFFRPWVLWDRCWGLAPEACARFARGLWEHQIGDQQTGNFSRHARYDKHGPGRDSQYPRHGGFYIATWASAYQHSKDPVFLEAIETLLEHFDSRRSPTSAAIPAENAARSRGQMVWPPSNLSLAVDLWEGASKVPDKLAEKMRRSASRTDQVFLKIEHDLGPRGKGFAGSVHTHTLEILDYSKGVWNAGYGTGNDANFANLCLLRWQQVKLDGYRKLILDTAGRYRAGRPDLTIPVQPRTLGDVIFLMIGAHQITGGKEYLDSAERFAAEAVKIYFPDESPLPKATSKHDHYESVTQADTLMMGLLQLWAIKNRPGIELRLVYNDR